MTPNEYKELCLRTEKPININIGVPTNRLLHAAMGMCTESGEFTDGIKRNIFYHKPFNVVNLIEELGDILWYVSIAIDALGTSFEEVMQANISKLQKRYPEGFSDEKAINRNLEEEIKALEEETK